MTRFNIQKAIPFMVTDAGELVCIPRTTDPPTIGVLGTKGKGKTLLMNGLCGRSYVAYKEDSFIVANDYMNESPYWLGQQEKRSFVKLLNAVGERPTKLPYVPVYPNHKDLIIDKYLPYYYKFGIPFKDFIKNIENHFEIKRSLVYFKNLVPKILDLKYPDMESISKIITDAKMNKDSKIMLINMIASFFEEKKLDLEKDSIGNVTLKDGKKNEGVCDLISGLAYSRHIPVFMTGSMINSQSSFQTYFSNILRTIFKNQLSGYSFKKGNVLNLFVDEMGILTDKDTPTPCTKILNELVAQGRPARIGFYYATQNPSKLPRKIKTNTKYTLCFGLDKSEVKYVNEITPFSRRERDSISSLKKFEVIANTVDEEWYFIDPYKKNNNCYKASGVVKGRILPPLSSTKPPIVGV